ncbi:MAG: hypothetical protein GTO03_08315 [Planctomycetales bacterium]|nr:hypothetical protein [Planctomycetales bacterium]
MEADNVVRIAPTVQTHTVYAGRENASGPTDIGQPEPVDAMAGQVAASPPDPAEKQPALAPHVITSHALPDGLQQNHALQSSQFVAISSLRNVTQPDGAPERPETGQETGTAAPPFQPTPAPAKTDDLSKRTPTIFVDAPHVPPKGADHDAAQEPASEVRQPPAGSAPQPPHAGPTEPLDPPRADSEANHGQPVTGQHPLIPVRPREYRQLFAKLRAQTSQSDHSR